jgi:hypothetical protein
MSDLEKARTVPCPGCKRPAGSACVDLETGAEATGVHQVRIYRAYVVAEADAHNRAVELEAEVQRLNVRLTAAHEALTRVEDDDPDEFVSLESTVDWVVTHYRALKKDFDELHDMLGTAGAR